MSLEYLSDELERPISGNSTNLPKYLASNQEYPNEPLTTTVLPILWSFLLEPGEPGDPTSDTNTCVDFKTVSSLFLVSKIAKEAFDACNGRRLLLEAWQMESICKLLYVHEKSEEIKNAIKNTEWSANGSYEYAGWLLGEKLSPLASVIRRIELILSIERQLSGHFASDDADSNEATQLQESLLRTLCLLTDMMRDTLIHILGYWLVRSHMNDEEEEEEEEEDDEEAWSG